MTSDINKTRSFDMPGDPSNPNRCRDDALIKMVMELSAGLGFLRQRVHELEKDADADLPVGLRRMELSEDAAQQLTDILGRPSTSTMPAADLPSVDLIEGHHLNSVERDLVEGFGALRQKLDGGVEICATNGKVLIKAKPIPAAPVASTPVADTGQPEPPPDLSKMGVQVVDQLGRPTMMWPFSIPFYPVYYRHDWGTPPGDQPPTDHVVDSSKKVDPPSESWLRRMADAEDAAGSVSVGGLASDLGMVDPPQREWWIAQTVYKDAWGREYSRAYVNADDLDSGVYTRVIPCPTDAEIEAAVTKGVEAWCVARSEYASEVAWAIRHAINHLLGGAKK